ncbi:MAG: signal peptidase II [Burkholderiaceae bacterium]
MAKAFRSSRRGLWPWLILIAAVIVVDQLTKIAIGKLFVYGERKELIHGFFDLTLVFNKGAAFSFLSNASGWQRWFFTGIGIVAAIFIVVMLARHASQKLFCTALALIAGGALGNVIDRLIHGHVVDFLLFFYRDWSFPAFNVADSAITVGAVLVVIDELLRVQRAR